MTLTGLRQCCSHCVLTYFAAVQSTALCPEFVSIHWVQQSCRHDMAGGWVGINAHRAESAERCWNKEPATHSATLHRNRPLHWVGTTRDPTQCESQPSSALSSGHLYSVQVELRFRLQACKVPGHCFACLMPDSIIQCFMPDSM